jgi:GNAT superfamily N-acetyltransferase
MTMKIGLAESADELERCARVLVQLRTALTCEQIVARIQEQRQSGYRVAYVESGGQIEAVAGFRVSSYLAWGRALYVDDLVAREEQRGRGFGSALFDWLVELARREGCEQLHLDSGVQRFAAHRFYLHKGMDITSHHFVLKLQR